MRIALKYGGVTVLNTEARGPCRHNINVVGVIGVASTLSRDPVPLVIAVAPGSAGLTTPDTKLHDILEGDNSIIVLA